ncbi:MAG: hypothetical protein ABIH76_08230 [Candidatus Bathyarchaeota archaeon]
MPKFKINQADSFSIEVEGKLIPFKGFEEFSFFIWEDSKRDWAVHETTTGVRIGNRYPNKMHAVKAAFRELKDHQTVLHESISGHPKVETLPSEKEYQKKVAQNDDI